MNYRNNARNAVERAKVELNSNDEHRVKYAALELRMALESLMYQQALSYRRELSDKKLSTWQPGKLLSLLIEIDPYADRSSTWSIGREDKVGEQAKVFTSIGTERLLTLKEIKKYYDRLGSYLHAPTIEQVKSGKGATPEKIRTRCGELCQILEEVLSSRVFNTSIKTTSEMSCEKCGENIVRRTPLSREVFIAKCINCSATYELQKIESNQIQWKAILHDVSCGNPECNKIMKLWECELKIGTNWHCSECTGKNTITLGVSHTYPEERG